MAHDDEDDYGDPVDTPEPEEEPTPKPAATKPRLAKVPTPPPIVEVETDATLHGLVKFQRAVSMGSKDNVAWLTCELPFAYQPGTPLESVAALAADYFFQCKAVVFSQANIPFEWDEGGVIHETVRRAFPDAEVERPAAKRAAREAPFGDDDDGDEPERRPRPRAAGKGGFPHPADMDRPSHVKRDLWNDLCNNYEQDWYDNRPKKSSGDYKSNASDFKNKDGEQAIWLKPPQRSAGYGSR